MGSNIAAVVQARVTSTRLPGKVLKTLAGKPMIIQQLERIDHCSMLDKVILATSVDVTDDPLAKVVQAVGREVFRGSLNNVLNRYYEAARQYSPDHVVRLTGDCPLVDPRIIDQVIQAHVEQPNDYTSNTLKPSYPDGLDVEVVTFSALEKCFKLARLPSELEHVTQYIHNHVGEFRVCNVKHKSDLSNMRWTVDEPEDFEFVETIYKKLFTKNPSFDMHDVLDLLTAEPELQRINHKFKRNEGLKKSQIADEEYLNQ